MDASNFVPCLGSRGAEEYLKAECKASSMGSRPSSECATAGKASAAACREWCQQITPGGFDQL